jgi:DNA modification methylase
MQTTEHAVIYADSRNLSFLGAASVDLTVTSPPYPMIGMWDGLFGLLNPEITAALEAGAAWQAFEMMHAELSRVWEQLFRVIRPGGLACINIGDATRSLNGTFRLFPNHARLIARCTEIGFTVLPSIVWRKPANSPTKFMGSGMLPPGAYVTLEHEHILILRKPGKRPFPEAAQKLARRRSAYFWEERNRWFSDLWDLRGIKQTLRIPGLRSRNAAYPFELAYRLVNMFSLRGDTVLDPFLGTGTSLYAALACGRNSVGVEIDSGFRTLLPADWKAGVRALNRHTARRLENHAAFVAGRRAAGQTLKYRSRHYGFPVMTRQEQEIVFKRLETVYRSGEGVWRAAYGDWPAADIDAIMGTHSI